MSLALAIRTAALERKADRVLQLCSNGLEGAHSVSDQSWIDAAQAVVDLALRMRLPYGRQGAWAKHLQLLQIACLILEHRVEAGGEQHNDPVVDTLLTRVRKLRG